MSQIFIYDYCLLVDGLFVNGAYPAFLSTLNNSTSPRAQRAQTATHEKIICILVKWLAFIFYDRQGNADSTVISLLAEKASGNCKHPY
jgi:hypothetical protein